MNPKILYNSTKKLNKATAFGHNTIEASSTNSILIDGFC